MWWQTMARYGQLWTCHFLWHFAGFADAQIVNINIVFCGIYRLYMFFTPKVEEARTCPNEIIFRIFEGIADGPYYNTCTSLNNKCFAT